MRVYKKTHKLTAAFTAFVFLLTNTVWAAGSTPVTTAVSPISNPPLSSTLVSHDISQLKIPESIGRIKTVHIGTRPQMVIHVQDAHASEGAQRNIAAILDSLTQNEGLEFTGVEGAEGDLSLRLLNFIPDRDVRKQMADYFLKNARIGGSEYYALVENTKAHLFGVEQSKTYEENRRLYLDALTYKARDEAVLIDLGKILQQLERFIFSEPLQRLSAFRRDLRSGAQDLPAYLKHLVELARENSISLDGYAQSKALLELLTIDSTLDAEAARSQMAGYLQKLDATLDTARQTELRRQLAGFRIKTIRALDFYTWLDDAGMSIASGVLVDFTLAQQYVRTLRLREFIDAGIFDEISALESAVKEKLFQSWDERQFDQLLRVFEIYEKVFDFTLTKSDAEFLIEKRALFSTPTISDFLKPLLKKYQFESALPEQMPVLDQDLPRIEAFYTTAIKRDHILIENAIQKLEMSGKQVMALVTGGFHTPGIEKYLRDHDYSYAVIVPAMTAALDADGDKARYEEALAAKPLPLFSELSAVYRSPNRGVLNDARFQIAAPLRALNEAGFQQVLARLHGALPESVLNLLGTEPMMSGADDFTLSGLLLSSGLYILKQGNLETALNNLVAAATATPGLRSAGKPMEAFFGFLENGDFVQNAKTGGRYFLFDETLRAGFRYVMAEFAYDGNASILTGMRDQLRVPASEETRFIDLGNGRALMGAWIPADQIHGNILPLNYTHSSVDRAHMPTANVDLGAWQRMLSQMERASPRWNDSTQAVFRQFETTAVTSLAMLSDVIAFKPGQAARFNTALAAMRSEVRNTSNADSGFDPDLTAQALAQLEAAEAAQTNQTVQTELQELKLAYDQMAAKLAELNKPLLSDLSSIELADIPNAIAAIRAELD
ncbi:MAG: hypothetical protein KBC91_08305, partial [Candidatus Omnitrophica bacterium]|nr:hypothetical protein [Candidatus Omnitrophota bacterium]